MTPSPIRPVSRTAPHSARRTRLLAASALCGVAAMLASPALAGTLPGIPSAANITVSSGGSQPTISFPDAITLQIDLNAPRTVINWTDLHLSSGDAMNFLFDAASDIVLNKTTSQIRFDNGSVVTGKIGAATAGNVWFYSPQGVIVSPGATMTAGSFVFSRGTGLNDLAFVGAADPLANLRAATDALIQMTTISSATSASINSTGDVVLSASSGALNVQIVEGATVDVSTTLGSITVSEATATSGAASVAAGGPGATVTQITGDTGVTVTSNNNTSVGSATTTTSGDILITSNGSASLTLGNSAQDVTISAPQVFVSTVDAGRDVFITGTTSAFVTNRIFAGDDIEITADGDVTASGAYLKSTGAGATDDAHILLRSDTGFVNAGNTLLTQGTGAQAGDITIQAATTATLGTADSTRDIKVTGVTASLANGSASRDVFVTATTGGATVTTAATAGDDVEVTATTGAVSASGATLKSTGVGATDDAHVLARSTGSTVNVGSAITQGTGAAEGDATISAATTATLGAGNSSRDLTVSGASASLTTGQSGRDLFVTATTGNATVTTYAIAGDDLEITTTSGNVLASNANLWGGYSGGSDDGHVLVRSTNGSVNVLSAESRGGGVTAGDTTIQAGTTATVAGAFGSRNLSITAANSFDLSGLYSANNTASFTSTAGAITESGGSVAAATLTLNGATGVTLGQINNITSLGASNSGTGSFTYRDVNNFALTGNITSGGDVSLFSNNGAISQSAGVITADTLNATAATGVTLNQANLVTSLGVLANGTSGNISFHNDGGFDLTGNVDSAGNVSLFSDNGDITQSGGTLHAGGTFSLDGAGLISVGDLSGDGGVDVTAAGDIDVTSATSGGGVSLQSNGGHAILRKAVLTGSGASDDLSIVAAGEAILGADDYTSITSDNVFSRTGGSSGAATIRSTAGDAHAYLDSSAAFTSLEGEGVDVTISTGPAAFDSITANSNNIYVEALDGALTVGSATAANGDVELYSAGGGDVTITGAVHAAGLVDIEGDGLLHLTSTSAVTSDDEVNLGGDTVTIEGTVHGDGPVQIGANGLIDGTAAIEISSGDDLTVIGGTVDVGSLQADGQINVAAYDGNLDIQSAHGGVLVQVAAFNGDIFVDDAQGDDLGFAAQALVGDVLVNRAMANGANGVVVVQAGGDATLRGAQATLGILVYASGAGKATFGADDRASIVTDNYAFTAANSGVGCGCGPLPDGLQVVSDGGDAVVNVNALSNPIALVSASPTGSATVVLTSGDLKIDQVLGYNISLDATDGTLETGLTTISGGDYTIAAHDFLGDALTPTLSGGLIHDVSISDRLGDLDLGTAAIHADHWLTILASDGAVTGAAQLSAGSGLNDGRVVVTGEGIALDTVSSDGSVTLEGGNGLVDVATSLDVWGNYNLRGGDFANAALTPQGSMLGTWAIQDRVGGFDFTGKTLHYGGAVQLFVDGVVNGGDITVDTGNIYAEVDSGHLGTLTGPQFVGATSIAGGIDVDMIVAGTTARVWASDVGTARLGGAIMTGPGAAQVVVKAYEGDAILGAATPGAITAANLVASAGATTTVDVTGVTGRVDVNLDHITGANLTTVDAALGAAVKVANGALAIDQLTAGRTSQVSGGGDTRLVSADVTGDLTVTSTAGGLRFGDATPGRVIAATGALTLNAATDISQQGALHAFDLGVTSGTGVVLLGANQVRYLDAVTVSAGGFAFHDTLGFDLYGAVNAVGQTVDLRSDGAIGQVSTGTITARTLKGSSVGGADFGAFNQVAELGDFSNTGGGLLRLVEGRSLTVTGTVFSTGRVALTSHGGMTIAAGGAIRGDGTGDAVTLVSDGVFTNARGADAVTAGNAAGRWLIYTQAVGNAQGSTAGNSFNGLSGKSFYGSAYDFFNERFAVTPNAGNRFVYAYQPILTVTPVSQTVTYNGSIPTTSAIITGLVNGDLSAEAITWSGAPLVAGATSKNVGTYALTANLGGLSSDFNYAFAGGTGSLRIDPKALTGVLTANNKTYDGATAATGAISLTGVLAGETVTASGTYAFADKNAGVGKTVTASGAVLAGADAGNYSLTSVSTALADILRRSVTVAADNGHKAFGQPDPTLTYRVTAGSVVAGDAFTGALARDVGELAGDYGIVRGTLALSANYDVTFTGAVLTIQPIPSNERGDGSSTLKYITQSPDFTLDWDPESHLSTEGQSPPVQSGALSGGGKVAALR